MEDLKQSEIREEKKKLKRRKRLSDAVKCLSEFKAWTSPKKRGHLLSIIADPDRDWGTPVPVSGHRPVTGFTQPVAKPLLLHKVWHPVQNKRVVLNSHTKWHKQVCTSTSTESDTSKSVPLPQQKVTQASLYLDLNKKWHKQVCTSTSTKSDTSKSVTLAHTKDRNSPLHDYALRIQNNYSPISNNKLKK